MKKFNTKRFSLIFPYTGDWFDPDLVNRDIVEDGKQITVFDLNEEQAKQALVVALRKITKLQQKFDKINKLLY